MRGRAARLAAVAVAVGVLLRLALPGVDGPAAVEGTEAPLQDAFWYLEGASGPIETGRDVEPMAVYDPPVWTHVARSWFRLASVSYGSAHLLAGLVSCATLLLVWRLAAAALGPASGAAAALALATAVPAVALGRSPLVYGPVGLALVVAAAAWLAARRRPAGQRLALEAAAWAVALLAVPLVRPPAGALVGGLVAASLVRARRPGRALVAVAAAALLLGLALWAIDPMGVVSVNRVRVWNYLPRGPGGALDLSPAGLALRVVRLLGSARADGSGSGLGARGFGLLAPGLCAAAGLGGLVLLRRWRALPPASREAAALAGGWLGAFVVGAVLLDYRPMRYSLVVAPPLALLAGVGVAGVGRPRGRAPVPPAWAIALGGGVGMLCAGNALDLAAGGGLGLGPLLAAAALGAAVGGAACAGALDGLAGALSARLRELLAVGLLAALVAPAAVGAARIALAPTWRARDDQAAVGLLLSPGASLAGPYASWAAVGHGLERRRGAWIVLAPEAVRDATIARLRELRATHLVLGLEPTINASVLRCFADAGAPVELVAAFEAPLASPVLIFRFAWATEVGYRLSDFERRREEDRRGGPVAREGDVTLHAARAAALILDGDPARARALGTDPRAMASLTQRLPNLRAFDDRP